MKALKTIGLLGVALAVGPVAAEEWTSDSTLVFLNPKTTSFWATATNNVLTLPVTFPSGATAATLVVTGVGYSHTYEGITESEFTLELPVATSPETENVFTLSLSFDDAASTVRTAKLGLVRGCSLGGETVTRCLVPADSRKWRKVLGQAVLPIPYGATSFTLDGVETDTGLDGSQGWYALGGLGRGKKTDAALVADETEYTSTLVGGPDGLLLQLK